MRKLALFSVLALSAAGCGDLSLAYGEANSIIAVMSPELWEEVGDELSASLEPTIRTVRAEKTFTVTHQDPVQPEWGNLRRFRQLLLVGVGEEPWIQEALAKVVEERPEAGLTISYDVWSRGQQVNVLQVSSMEAAADEVREHLQQINELLDEQYRGYARNRMFMTGVDTALADTLMRTSRFEMFLPNVYDWSRQDSLFIFRNDNPDPSELIRQIAVTWRSPVPEGMQPEGILEWRAETAERYGEPQDVRLEEAQAGPTEFRGQPAYEIQAIWQNPPELDWPAAGPFITRAVICAQQDRMYLLDAWLYAPGREKYEYMIQLETILDSFRCGPG